MQCKAEAAACRKAALPPWQCGETGPVAEQGVWGQKQEGKQQAIGGNYQGRRGQEPDKKGGE